MTARGLFSKVTLSTRALCLIKRRETPRLNMKASIPQIWLALLLVLVVGYAAFSHTPSVEAQTPPKGDGQSVPEVYRPTVVPTSPSVSIAGLRSVLFVGRSNGFRVNASGLTPRSSYKVEVSVSGADAGF